MTKTDIIIAALLIATIVGWSYMHFTHPEPAMHNVPNDNPAIGFQ